MKLNSSLLTKSFKTFSKCGDIWDVRCLLSHSQEWLVSLVNRSTNFIAHSLPCWALSKLRFEDFLFFLSIFLLYFGCTRGLTHLSRGLVLILFSLIEEAFLLKKKIKIHEVEIFA